MVNGMGNYIDDYVDAISTSNKDNRMATISAKVQTILGTQGGGATLTLRTHE